jgi:hypothetical protein
MPTGYTYEVVEGKVTDFPTFALTCARAFGACITMRDEPADAPIPEEFAPSTYSATRLIEAKAKLEQLRAMTLEQVAAAAVAAYEQGCRSADEYDAKQAAEDNRLDAMLTEVEKWTPPTAEHVEMKTFMVEQLTISRHGDYRASRPKKLTGKEWLEDAIRQAMRDVEYHTAEQAKEEERAKGRTAWVKALRQSLQPLPQQSPNDY